MPEWMQLALDNGDPLAPIETVVVRVIVSLVCGLIVAGLYRITLGKGRKDLRSLPTTLVLLALLIAVITLVIGNNVARAFGLVGALSIVRFRTVVEDTGDTAFVIFAVTLGMAVGSGYTVLAAIAIPAVALAMLIMSRLDISRPAPQPTTLTVRFSMGLDPAALLAPTLTSYATAHTLTGLDTATKGTTLEARYSVRLREPSALVPLLNELSKLEGVLGVELKQANGFA